MEHTEHESAKASSPSGKQAPQQFSSDLSAADSKDFKANPNEDHEQRIRDLENQVKEKENKHLYLYSEFENFKRRTVKERQDLLKFGIEPFARDLLQVIDNLERALEHVPQNADPSLAQGLRMVVDQFQDILKKQGVEKVESLGKPFDPHLHEAVGQEPSSLPEGTVVKEHSRGYTLHGRLLRPSRVIVSAGEEGVSESEKSAHE